MKKFSDEFRRFNDHPARGGAKGICGKEAARHLRGRPLLAYAIAAARKATTINRFVNSDSKQILATTVCLAGNGRPYLRPTDRSAIRVRRITVLAMDFQQEPATGHA